MNRKTVTKFIVIVAILAAVLVAFNMMAGKAAKAPVVEA